MASAGRHALLNVSWGSVGASQSAARPSAGSRGRSEDCDWSECYCVSLLSFQLQDTLLQREEELARLQEENNNLREFLNSSFVRNLEQKAKVGSPSSSSSRR